MGTKKLVINEESYKLVIAAVKFMKEIALDALKQFNEGEVEYEDIEGEIDEWSSTLEELGWCQIHDGPKEECFGCDEYTVPKKDELTKDKEMITKFVIEKLVSELNAQVGPNDCEYIEIYDEEVDEINEGIAMLGIDACLKSDHDYEDGEEEE